jgi:hypothetical protein
MPPPTVAFGFGGATSNANKSSSEQEKLVVVSLDEQSLHNFEYYSNCDYGSSASLFCADTAAVNHTPQTQSAATTLEQQDSSNITTRNTTRHVRFQVVVWYVGPIGECLACIFLADMHERKGRRLHEPCFQKYSG